MRSSGSGAVSASDLKQILSTDPTPCFKFEATGLRWRSRRGGGAAAPRYVVRRGAGLAALQGPRDPRTDLLQLVHLLLGELVEQRRPYGLDVPGGGPFQDRHPLLGERGDA